MRHFQLIGILIALSLCSVVIPVFAEEQNLTEPVVVTASRIAQNNYKITGSVTVIKEDEIKASNAHNVPDLLKEALAIHVVDNSSAKTSVLDMRGFGDTASRNVLVLVNDRILNTADISSPDLLQIPLSSVERIEIIHGAGSVLFGDRAVGGVVNIITKKGKGDFKGRLGSYLGSYDRRGADIEISGEKNNISYFGYAKYDDDHGYRQNSDVLSKDFNTRLGYTLTDKVGVDVDYSFHEDVYGLPFGLTGAQLSAQGPRATTSPNDFSKTKDNNLKFGFDVTPWPQDLYLGTLALALYFRDRDVFDSFSGFDTSRTIKTTGITSKYIFDHEILNREVHIVTGMDFYDSQNDIVGSGSNTDDVSVTKRDIGLYGFGEFEAIENVFVNGGLRYYKADYAFSQRNSVNVDEKQHPDALVYLGGAKYEYAKGSDVHASVQKTFRFLATDEWYSSFSGTLDTSLNQQKGIQYEVGVKHDFDDKLWVSVTPYLVDNQDEIYFDPATFSNSNYEKTRRYGVELGTNVDVLKFLEINQLNKLNWKSSYTFQRPEFKGGVNDGKEIPLVPNQLFSTGLMTGFLKNYNLSIFENYVGSQWAINDLNNSSPKVEPYLTTDLKLAYEQKNWELYGSLNNVFDQQYSSTVSESSTQTSQTFLPAQGRNFNVGVNVKF